MSNKRKRLNMQNVPETKVCAKCKKVKVSLMFGVLRSNKDGLNDWCKECRNEYEGARRYKSPEFLQREEMRAIGKKRCYKCKTFLDLSEFYNNKNSKDNKDVICKKCKAFEAKKRFAVLNFKPSLVGESVCITCHLLLPVYSFSCCRTSTSGRLASCKKCESLRRKRIRSKLNNSFDPNSSKKCCRCSELKSATDFYPDRRSRDGLMSWCKICDGKRSKKRRKTVSFEADPNGVKICACCRKEKKSSDFPRYHSSVDGLYSYCKECAKEKEKLLRKRNKEYRLSIQLRQRLNALLRKYGLGKRLVTKEVINLLGCTMEEFVAHLEKQFYPNPETGLLMTWQTYGVKGWQIDHIIPLSKVDLSDPKQLARVTHYSNLQPMWAKENNRKHSNLPENWNLQEWLEEIDYAA